MVFQIRDDILDITATDGELQKPPGQDLAEGIYTLPALVALADPDSGPDLRALLGQPLGQPERDKARAIVTASRGIAAAVDQARAYVHEAQRATAGIGRPDLRPGSRGGGRAAQRPARLTPVAGSVLEPALIETGVIENCQGGHRRDLRPVAAAPPGLRRLAGGADAAGLRRLGQARVHLGLTVLHPGDAVADGGGQLGVTGRVRLGLTGLGLGHPGVDLGLDGPGPWPEGLGSLAHRAALCRRRSGWSGSPHRRCRPRRRSGRRRLRYLR